MARPIKNTVDYFSHDCDAQNKRTLTILQFKYKNDGYATWFKLLEILGSTDGHVVDCRNVDTWEFLQAKTLVEDELLIKILNTCADIDAIDKTFWSNKVIWCQNFVNRLDGVYKNRNQPLPQKPVILPNNPTVDIVSTPDNPTTDIVSSTETPQSIVKDSIVKDSKVEKKRPPDKKAYGEFNNVFLTDDEYKKLEARFNSSLTGLIEKLSRGIESKGYKYKSCYATILNWADRDNEKKSSSAQKEKVNNGLYQKSSEPPGGRQLSNDELRESYERFQA